jgi:hypothetical protein
MVQWWAFVVSDEPDVSISYSIVIKHNVGSGTSQTAHTCNGTKTTQPQHSQLSAVGYHTADCSISYVIVVTDGQFFQTHTSVNTNTQ